MEKALGGRWIECEDGVVPSIQTAKAPRARGRRPERKRGRAASPIAARAERGLVIIRDIRRRRHLLLDEGANGVELDHQIGQRESPKMMDFGTLLREARSASGITQQETARRAGISPHAVFEAERGNGTIETLNVIVRALDIRFSGLPRGARTWGEQVQLLRHRRGLSQRALAEVAGVSEMAISRLERGNARMATLAAALSVLAPQARLRKSDRAQWAGGRRDCRFTPPEVLNKIERILGDIELDPAADRSAFVRAERYLYEDDDGLAHDWRARTVYCNPPYSAAARWIAKAHESWTSGVSETILMLLPAQVHTITFHERAAHIADILLLRGRIRFLRDDGTRDHAPFGCMFILYGGTESAIATMIDEFPGVHIPRRRGP